MEKIKGVACESIKRLVFYYENFQVCKKIKEFTVTSYSHHLDSGINILISIYLSPLINP
jgi:hypothetical protein